MANKRPKNFTSTTPAGTFRYPSLDKPDFGNDEFPKPAGVYKVQLILSEQEAEPLVAQLLPLYNEAMAAGEELFKALKVEARKKLKEMTRNDLFAIEYDKDTEEPTGNVIFKFDMVASGISKKDQKPYTRKPVVFDAKGKPMLKVPAVWGGTVGKVSFEAAPYFIPGTGSAGLKLRLNGVQIIDLVSGGNRSASDFGFGEEDGYEAGPDAPEEDTGGFKDESGHEEF